MNTQTTTTETKKYVAKKNVKDKEASASIELRKLSEGETINYANVILSECETKLNGLVLMAVFVDAEGTIVAKTWVNNAMRNFLEKNPKATSITLEKIVKDGSFSYYIYS